MKLNPDCIRDLMIALEEITGVVSLKGLHFKCVSSLSLSNRTNIKEKYSEEEVVYTLIQLAESGYIRMDINYTHSINNAFSLGNVLYVTPKGHEFLSKINDENRWSGKIKPLIDAFGGISLSVIEAIASGVTSVTIDKLLKI